MRLRATTAVAAILLVAGCTGSTDTPSPPAPTASRCVSPSGPATPVKNDAVFTDNVRCINVSLGDIATAAREELGQHYNVNVVMPTQTFACTRDGKKSIVKGEERVISFCDGRKDFVLTVSGVTKATHGTDILGAWFIISLNSSVSRFSTTPQALCAAGFITAKRAGYSAAENLTTFMSLRLPKWQTKDIVPGQYALYGQHLALDGKGIAACAYPMPVARPS